MQDFKELSDDDMMKKLLQHSLPKGSLGQSPVYDNYEFNIDYKVKGNKITVEMMDDEQNLADIIITFKYTKDDDGDDMIEMTNLKVKEYGKRDRMEPIVKKYIELFEFYAEPNNKVQPPEEWVSFMNIEHL